MVQYWPASGKWNRTSFLFKSSRVGVAAKGVVGRYEPGPTRYEVTDAGGEGELEDVLWEIKDSAIGDRFASCCAAVRVGGWRVVNV